ncbi:hypothetical protein ABEB36_002436 [Hypothenemus hampei]|uniref:Cyclic nucleotide-binding domain-containing protein n=1 Tax=Hypothenemus hampei TaxID=57062 RepID=A0ABD1F5Q9_HYPHA
MAQRKKVVPAMSPEEKLARENRARRKFKAFVRLVIANLFWLGDLDDTLGENVILNIQKLTRKKIKKSTLTTQEKIILTKPKEERTDEEKQLLNRAIGGMKCFRKYPSEVKGQLAAVTYFVYIGSDRVIVKQDHIPTAMYFLLSGEALVTVKTYDKRLKEWIEEEHGTVGPGTMFGEVALIHGISRTATITTTVPCELLMIKKEDFDIVLKETVWKAWEEITKIMNRYSYFKNWNSVIKRECSIISRTKTYTADQIILGDGIGLPTYSYLITKGCCSIVEHLQVLVHYVNGVKKYRLMRCDSNLDLRTIETKTKPKKSKTQSSFLSKRIKSPKNGMGKKKLSVKSKKSKNSYESIDLKMVHMETHFLKVCELSEGAFFNVGENFERRRVIADVKTDCLLIPSYWLMKMNKDNTWSRVQQFLNNRIPSTKKIFEEWIKEKKFISYKKKLVKDLLAQKRISNTNCIHNVPYSIRLKENTGA